MEERGSTRSDRVARFESAPRTSFRNFVVAEPPVVLSVVTNGALILETKLKNSLFYVAQSPQYSFTNETRRYSIKRGT